MNIRKLGLALAILVALCAGYNPVSAAQKPQVEIKDTSQFFNWFAAMKDRIPEKDVFETDEQYAKRLPPPFNSSKTVYFRVEEERTYSYDIDSRQLVTYAARCCDLPEFGRGTMETDGHYTYDSLRGYETVQLLIRSDLLVSTRNGIDLFTNKPSGVKFICHNCNSYVLNLANLCACPKDLFDQTRRRFAVTISADPKVAKAYSKSLEIIVGVRLFGFGNCDVHDMFIPSAEASKDKPNLEVRSKTIKIDGDLVQVLVRDKNTGGVVFSRTIPVD